MVCNSDLNLNTRLLFKPPLKYWTAVREARLYDIVSNLNVLLIQMSGIRILTEVVFLGHEDYLHYFNNGIIENNRGSVKTSVFLYTFLVVVLSRCEVKKEFFGLVKLLTYLIPNETALL